jgi:hypothetical protein
MRTPLAFAWAILLALVATLAAAQVTTPPSEDDWAEIRRIIGEQREALIAGDAERAFGYAAPGIRTQFGDARAFMRMVERGYRALLVARYAEFLEGAVVEGEVIQPLRLVAPDGTVEVALYSLARQRDGRWRIAGCLIAPSTVRSA